MSRRADAVRAVRNWRAMARRRDTVNRQWRRGAARRWWASSKELGATADRQGAAVIRAIDGCYERPGYFVRAWRAIYPLIGNPSYRVARDRRWQEAGRP